jgi:type IV secretory pathway TraG/TraD family ATPase VirD4
MGLFKRQSGPTQLSDPKQKVYDLLKTKFRTLPGTGQTIDYDMLTKNSMCFGAAGMGKTSSYGKWIMEGYASQRIGGLVCCVKADEPDRIENICKKQGHTDIVRFGKGSPYRFNLLESLAKLIGKDNITPTQLTETVMSLSMTLSIARGENIGNVDQYWSNYQRKILNFMFWLLLASDQTLSFRNLNAIVMSLAGTAIAKRAKLAFKKVFDHKLDKKERASATQDLEAMSKSSALIKFLCDAAEKATTSEKQQDFAEITQFFLDYLPSQPEKTLASALGGVTGLLGPFSLPGALRTYFDADEPSKELDLSRAWTDGTVFICDFPCKKDLSEGVISNAIMKMAFQIFVEGRVPEEETDPRLCFLFMDEYQLLCDPIHDHDFLSSSRSVLCATSLLTQNLDGLVVAFGGDERKALNLLGNCATLVGCANANTATNEFFEKTIGQDYVAKQTMSFKPGDSEQPTFNSGDYERRSKIDASAFTKLNTGAAKYDFIVESIVFHTGLTWKQTGDNYAVASFNQRG